WQFTVCNTPALAPLAPAAGGSVTATRTASARRRLPGVADGVHLQDLVAEVVDHLHRDLAAPRRVERLARRAVQLRPLALVDLRAKSLLQLVVGAFLRVLAPVEEVGVPDEEALSVIVGVDEPAGDVVGVARPH